MINLKTFFVICPRLMLAKQMNMHQKLVAVVWYQKLARVSLNLVTVFLEWNRTQLNSITETA